MPGAGGGEDNRALWDEMARVHIGVYKEVELLRRGEEILDPVELREIGEVSGKTMLQPPRPHRDRFARLGATRRPRDGRRLPHRSDRLREGIA